LNSPCVSSARIVDDDAVGLGHRLQPRRVRRIANGGDFLDTPLPISSPTTTSRW
jgi:hypothetical protein